MLLNYKLSIGEAKPAAAFHEVGSKSEVMLNFGRSTEQNTEMLKNDLDNSYTYGCKNSSWKFYMEFALKLLFYSPFISKTSDKYSNRNTSFNQELKHNKRCWK